MNCGGVERALINLLQTIPKKQYECHVGLLGMTGGLLDSLPKEVHIHRIDCFDNYWETFNNPPLTVIRRLYKKGKIVEATTHLLFYIQYKLTNNRYLFYKWIMRNTPISPDTYDMAVAFAGPSQMIDFYVCDKMQAKMKIGWIHFDVNKFGIDRGMIAQLYKAYKKIFFVSKTAKKHFDELFPQFKDKTEVRYNVIPQQQIRKMADAYVAYQDGFKGKRILTVGRLSAEKGQDVAIEALKLVRERGYNIKWYFVGDGNLTDRCKQLASTLNLSEYVAFEGTQVNPYPYMKDCEVYVQPSRYEGYCITLAEARLFAAPIVATCFTGAQEQLKDHPNGIVTGMKAEEVAGGITKALNLIEHSR